MHTTEKRASLFSITGTLVILATVFWPFLIPRGRVEIGIIGVIILSWIAGGIISLACLIAALVRGEAFSWLIIVVGIAAVIFIFATSKF